MDMAIVVWVEGHYCLEMRIGTGKSKMQVIGAAMRKLLHLAFGVMKSGNVFDPNHLNPA